MYDYRGKKLMRILTHQNEDEKDLPPTLIFEEKKHWDVVGNLRTNLVVGYHKNVYPTVDAVVDEIQKIQKEVGKPPMEEW